ncbi:MAG: hypothetical protein HY321_02860 [Armatimonadetes bacterium]|nr:hypothetical protein [Armatimonadota bacterium]
MVRKLVVLGVAAAVLSAGAAAAQRGRGGWWSRVTPTTAEQKVFVDEATALRTQIWQKQAELRSLTAQPKPSESAVKAKQAEVDALREKLHALVQKNRSLIQEMAPAAGRGGPREGCPGYGPCGGAPGSACPMGGPGAGRARRGDGAGCPMGGPGAGRAMRHGRGAERGPGRGPAGR